MRALATPRWFRPPLQLLVILLISSTFLLSRQGLGFGGASWTGDNAVIDVTGLKQAKVNRKLESRSASNEVIDSNKSKQKPANLKVKDHNLKDLSSKIGHQNTKSRRPIWASMSICWGKNVQAFDKEHFPYSEAAHLAALLWANQTNHQVSVILTIVTERGRPADPGLSTYIARVEAAGVRVELQEDQLGDCVLQGQVARMYAWNYSYVEPTDVIIMADADAFIIGDEVIQMLNQPAKVWVGQFLHTEANAGTIILPLTAMAAGEWRGALDFSTSKAGCPVGLVAVARHFQRVSSTTLYKDQKAQANFEVDQVILSSALLRPDRPLCSLPANNPLWAKLNIKPHETNDTGVCYHGKLLNCFRLGWSVRNMDLFTLYQQLRGNIPPSCPWWHFRPTDGLGHIHQIYDDILSGALNSKGRNGGGAMDEFGPLNAVLSKIIPSCKDWPFGPSCPKRTVLPKQ